MNVALLLSGGRGERMGGEIPKQYRKAGGRLIIAYSMETLFAHPDIDAVQIAAEPAWREVIAGCGVHLCSAGLWSRKFRGFSLPGKTRQLSVFYGLEAVRSYAKEKDYVLIHDAARPFVSSKQITDCIDSAKEHEGAMPVLPMKDTVYQSRDGRTVESLLERGFVYRGQTPEVFELGRYYEANVRLMPDEILKIHGSTEPAVMAGMDIALIPGDEENFKITTRVDLEKFCRMMERPGGDML